ncbi:hypothetical protein CDD80_4010 [Ophiocordyceps camponoti-rufipedis]|uniref:Uncharacterized protein n=1 Tax=Ophiocordyceps camponoti-rufipedis TaxID=2004952 RepID=A0A2C5YWM9_9HYPO|nr:hypothetical protein CDD80_4010 [Ophiocordyceps camponoti-rufipedis]
MQANNTLVDWRSDPERRGTIDIVKSCVFTIVACTWTIQHLNLPVAEDGLFTKFGRKLKWAALTALFPELILAHAFLEFTMVIDVMNLALNTMNQGTKQDEPWTVPEDIKDKSKRDYFAKGIAVLQLGQLFVSAIVRLANGWAFSQLEMITLALAGYGFLTYLAYWYKPQDVEVPLEVDVNRKSPKSDQLKHRLEVRTFGSGWGVLSQDKNLEKGAPQRIPNDNIPLFATVRAHYTVTFFSVVFGGFHVIAWNFSFPTIIEQWLWRVASLLSTVLPVASFLIVNLSNVTKKSSLQGRQMFMGKCIQAMREYTWYHGKNTSPQVRTALKMMQTALNDPKEHLYRKILRPFPRDDSLPEKETVGSVINQFIKDNEKILFHKDEFPQQFCQLLDIIEHVDNNLKLATKGHTQEWPVGIPATGKFSRYSFIAMGMGYLLSRVVLIAVACSSLRRMPDSVYVTSWTREIPSVR